MLLAVFLLMLEAVAAAAPLVKLQQVRWSSAGDTDRIVFELSGAANHKVRTENNGQRIVLEIMSAADRTKSKPAIRSSQIKNVRYNLTEKGRIVVTIELNDPAEYDVRTLKSPHRIYIDIEKNYERIKRTPVLEGITHITYSRRTVEGPVLAHFLDVDNRKYKISPALAGGKVRGRATTAEIARANGAAAAINASYFDPDGTILGYLRMDGTTVGTTYFNRSALGIRKDGTMFIDKLSYNCQVSIAGATLFASGVNAERGNNGLVIYNRYFDSKTGTNEFGKEFIVRGNVVSQVKTGNSVIPSDGLVISVHGTAKNTFSKVRPGARVIINENTGRVFAGVPQVIGGGPRLVRNGLVYVTAQEEQFPDDIAVGRAPRTGFGIMRNGHFLLGVVDGRQSTSIGCTLTEWAELMKKMGAREAINFDGGGSTEMVLKNRVVNSPSDGSERPVGSALIVTAVR